MSLDELDPERLYHLASIDEWTAYRAGGAVTPASLGTEGFVHCSWGRQVPGTIERHFAGVSGLLALELDARAFGATALVEEDSYGSGQVFPHAYGPVPVEAVVAVVPVA